MKSHPIQQEFLHQQREYHHLYKEPTHDNHCLFHVLRIEHLENKDIWHWAWVAESFGAELQVCVEQDTLSDIRGRRQE